MQLAKVKHNRNIPKTVDDIDNSDWIFNYVEYIDAVRAMLNTTTLYLNI